VLQYAQIQHVTIKDLDRYNSRDSI